MENKEILQHLRTRRDITAFAKYIGISPQGLYKLLRKEDKKSNQYYNFIRFVLDKYKSK
jgi:DNA-binding phage protein